MKRSGKNSSQEGPPAREPWLPLQPIRGKRVAQESEANYAPFEIYYTMDPAERSLRKVAARVGLSESWIERLSISFQWSWRADAWDRQQARRRAVEFEEQQRLAIRLEVQRLATTAEDRAQKLLQRKAQIREGLFATAQSMPNASIATITVVDGVRIVTPQGWSFLKAAQLLLGAHELSGRAIRGDCTAYCNVVPGDLPPCTGFDAHPTTAARCARKRFGTDPPWFPLSPKQGKGDIPETGLNYEAFRLYYTASVDRRSLRQVALHLNKSPQLLERWSTAFRWSPRTEAWDRHLEGLRQEARDTLEQELAKFRAERLEQRREELYQLSVKMEAVANTMLDFPLKTTSIKDSDGRVKSIVKSPRWRIVMGVQMLEMGFALSDKAIRNDDVPQPTDQRRDISTDTASWLRLPPGQGKGGATETALNYAAFEIYYGMAAAERRLRRVAQELGKTEKQMEQWSSRFHWWERATARDDHFSEQREVLARQHGEKWEKRRVERRERACRNSGELLDKGEAIATSPLTKTTTRTRAGRRVETIWPNWSKRDQLRMARIALKLGEQAIRNE